MPDTLADSVDRAAEDRSEIADLIHRETDCFRRMDFDGWADCRLQSPRDREVSISPGLGITVMRGWDTIRADMLRAMGAGRTPCGMAEFRKDDMEITVQGDMAWVTYDGWMKSDDGSEIGSFETNVLERTNAGWRLAYLSFAHRQTTRTSPGHLAVDNNGQVVWTAPGTMVAIRDHPTLTISHGRLRARRRDWDRTLQDALARAGALHGFHDHHRFVEDTGAPFRAPVILGEDADGAAMVCALVVMDGLTYLDFDPAARVGRRLAAARAIFGLSEGQTRLAARIASGENLTDAAKTLGISINTARTHLTRIYQKTGVNAQTALVRLLLSVG